MAFPIMPLLHVIFLAILQGATEFLPISSSAHLALMPWLFGWPDQGLVFDIALHLGTLAAVLMYFFRDWLQVLAQGFGIDWGPDPELRKNPRLLWLLAAASIPIGILGYALEHYAEHAWRTPWVIGGMLIAVALLMAWAERAGTHTKDIGAVSLRDSLTIGAAQALAIVPGTSRSGITITAGLFRNLSRPAAARFSFLLSTPAIAAAGLKAAWDLKKSGGIPPGMHTPFFLGVAVSAVTGCLVIAFFLRWLKTHNLRFFIAYRIIFGIIVIALAVYRLTAG
jgi:undecaprenyl-diphosphatase